MDCTPFVPEAINLRGVLLREYRRRTQCAPGQAWLWLYWNDMLGWRKVVTYVQLVDRPVHVYWGRTYLTYVKPGDNPKNVVGRLISQREWLPDRRQARAPRYKAGPYGRSLRGALRLTGRDHADSRASCLGALGGGVPPSLRAEAA